MVTIIVDTDAEYIEMKELAKRFICGQIRYSDCIQYRGHCWECYRDNHTKCGIRIIPPVDNDKPSEL